MILKKFINLKRAYKSLILAFVDFFILLFSVWSSFSLRFEEFYSFNNINFKYLCILIIFFFLIQYKDKIYNLPSRNFNTSIVFTILKNAFIACLFFSLVNLQFYKIFNVPRSIPIVIFFILASLIILKHSLIINFFYFFKRNIQKINNNILIYGFSNQAIAVGDELKRNITYNFVGYSDIKKPKEKIFDTFYKLEKINDLINIVKKKKITHLAISKKLNYKKKIFFLKLFKDFNLRTIFLDDIYNINNLGYNSIKFRPEYNDILGRYSIDHLENIKKDKIFLNKVVVITGAGGSIGSELANKIMQFNFHKLILIDVNEFSLHALKQKIIRNKKSIISRVEFKLLNLNEKNLLEEIFKKNKIDFIYHAAAYKHVSIVESNMRYGIKNNVIITKNICELSLKYGVKTNLLVSTDKAVNPKSAMGLSKRVCENIFKYYSKNSKKINFIITRFGNVVGSSGSVLPIFRNCLEQNLPISVTHKKASRYVMTIDEACALVLKSSIIGKNGNFYVFEMGKPINILYLAKLFINMHGFRYCIIKKNLISKFDGSVPIIFTGLQKGEKLHEELAYNQDLIKTNHPKIMISQETFLKIRQDYLLQIKNFEKKINNYSDSSIKKLLAKLI